MKKKHNSKKVLVIEIFYYKVIVSIAQKKAKETQLLHSVKRQSIFPLEGLVQCLQELKAKHKRLPNHAICINTDNFGGIVNVKENQESPELQAQWELENSLLNSLPRISVDQLLQDEGFLSSSQLEKMMLFEKTQTMLSENFCDRALKASILDEDRLEEIEYFLDQRPDFNEADNFDCALLQADKVRGDLYSCTVSSNELKREIYELLKSQKINLLTSIPWSLSSLSKECLRSDGNALYIEKHPAFWYLLQFKKGRLVDSQFFISDDNDFTPELIQRIDELQIEAIQLVAPHHKIETLNEICSLELEAISTDSNAPQHCAANLTWQLDQVYKPVATNVIIPPTPLRQKPAFLWTLVIMVTIIFCSTYFYTLILEKNKAEKKYKELYNQNELLQVELSSQKKAIQEDKVLQRRLKPLKQQFDKLNTNSEQVQTADFSFELLHQISMIKLQGIELSHINVSHEGDFLIEGMSVNTTQPHKFNLLLNNHFEKLNAQVKINEESFYYMFSIKNNKKLGGKR